MKNRKKKIITGFAFFSILFGSIFYLNVNAATKTAGARVESSYVWVMSTLYADYNTSTKVISGANMKRVYTFPGVSSAKERVISLKTYSTTGKLTAALAGTTKSDTVTINTK